MVIERRVRACYASALGSGIAMARAPCLQRPCFLPFLLGIRLSIAGLLAEVCRRNMRVHRLPAIPRPQAKHRVWGQWTWFRTSWGVLDDESALTMSTRQRAVQETRAVAATESGRRVDCRGRKARDSGSNNKLAASKELLHGSEWSTVTSHFLTTSPFVSFIGAWSAALIWFLLFYCPPYWELILFDSGVAFWGSLLFFVCVNAQQNRDTLFNSINSSVCIMWQERGRVRVSTFVFVRNSSS